jgi:hypothetical protein
VLVKQLVKIRNAESADQNVSVQDFGFDGLPSLVANNCFASFSEVGMAFC